MPSEKPEPQYVPTRDRPHSIEPEDPEKAVVAVPPVDESKIVGGYKLVLMFIGMLLSALLVSLDQTIVATAIPRIASEFNALDEVTWIASAYFLTQCSLALTYGKVLAAVTTKWVYLFAVTIFEVGSAICGAAPNVEALIIGRAIAGVGASGIFTSCLAVLAVVTRLDTRPILFGLFGGVFAVANVIGPLLGGAFTDHVYSVPAIVSLPLGAITIATILVFIEPKHSTVEPAGFKETMRRLAGIDWIGAILSTSMIISILLPLQWGGVTKPWNDKTVIALFCVFAVLLAAFVGWEWYIGEEKATMPLSMWTNRTQVGCCLEGFLLTFAMLCAIYYLPLYYQSAQQHTATRSGIDILALMCSIIFGASFSGAVIHLNCIFASQAEYSKKPELIPQSTALVNFSQAFGGTLGIAVAGTVFGNKLGTFVSMYAPGLPPEVVTAVKQSVEAIKLLPPEVQSGVVTAYSKALGYVFIIGIPSSIFASVAGCLVRNYNVKKMALQPGAHAA
ncbi:hypothetical protein FRC00_003864 [Tulasnella sp. 408]|nr:hypothetical protein FRC00_003864 [Tulasnella sp. 408]